MAKFSAFFSYFKQPKALPEIQDAPTIESDYKHWRIRIFYSMYIGYAVYYVTRKSFTFAIPSLSADLNMDKASLGWLGSMLAISYGLSKLISGMLSDNANARYFMAVGLILTGVFNIIFGTASTFWVFALCWMLNGWFQGFGWPPCAKFLTYWYSQSERGRWWGAWNTSHNLGGAIIPILIAFCADTWGWRSSMYVAGGIAIITGLWLINRLRDTPATLGLPSIEKYKNEIIVNDKNNESSEESLTVKEIFMKYILKNKYIWILAGAYFFIYIIRIAINDWTMPYLMEKKGYTRTMDAGKVIFAFEIGGVFGSLVAGWLSDKLFKGGRGPVNLLFTICITILIAIFWQMSVTNLYLDILIVGAIGFFVFGPQMLIGIAAVELSHKKAAATSTGFIGWIGYLGAVVAGGPIGMLLDKFGWNSFFITTVICGIIACVFLAFLYNARVYKPNKSSAIVSEKAA
ncbi:phosphoglycerate transporter protein PgtP [Fluviispira multicolorata]|uniref:MFS transporter n=1 Tax=Fluviispira multicolorata TaxID=2654512 RepID=A0A833JCM0_9BACT|nr:phosphoglycerate transporter protein PgtP [Fluviispira multicolorata]KAB8030808.1 MFS transporter [Fluviispira multicolorata]